MFFGPAKPVLKATRAFKVRAEPNWVMVVALVLTAQALFFKPAETVPGVTGPTKKPPSP